jgi:glucose-6-phosphate isomerase
LDAVLGPLWKELKMEPSSLESSPHWSRLQKAADAFSRPGMHLGRLIKAPGRLEALSLDMGSFFYDFCRQRVDTDVMAHLRDLAVERNVLSKFQDMVDGALVNNTEQRAALHTAARSFSGKPVKVSGVDVMPDIQRVREEIRLFSARIRSGEITGTTGKRFTDVVVIGIGGSYLGTEFVSEALSADADTGIRLHYLSNVDIHNFGRIASGIEPDSTLWIVISKSYTTAETQANENLARAYLEENGLDPSSHIVTVTAKGSPGDSTGNEDVGNLATFHMFDFIGGRYSVSSAVGGVPLSLFLGYECFERFLKGAEEMDRHAADADVDVNIPLTAALLSVWNANLLGYPAQAIIPYATPLAKLAAHVQQLNMESNGKSVSAAGDPLPHTTGTIIFGEPGTNAQHSFFQLLHQGRPVPVEFIGVLTPQYPKYDTRSKGVTNHQELWANLMSQPMALAMGKADPDPARSFSGNRPSSTIVLPDLSPESVGRLLSFYEAKTVFEAFLWGINPFDQFGVELGKQLASGIRKEMADRNENPAHAFEGSDAITAYYLEKLFSGS